MPLPEDALGGVRVVIFETRRADELTTMLERHGATVMRAPALREASLPRSPAALELARRLEAGEVDVVILLTGVGTRALAAAVADVCPDFTALLARTDRRPRPEAAGRAARVEGDGCRSRARSLHLARGARDRRHAPARPGRTRCGAGVRHPQPCPARRPGGSWPRRAPRPRLSLGAARRRRPLGAGLRRALPGRRGRRGVHERRPGGAPLPPRRRAGSAGRGAPPRRRRFDRTRLQRGTRGPRRDARSGGGAAQDGTPRGTASAASAPTRESQLRPATSATMLTSSDGSTGFTTCRSKPEASAFTRSSARA